MPLGDSSGPMGQGSMTGRSLGFCSGFDTPGYTKGMGKGMGRGMGRGFGFGRGISRGFGFGRGQNFGWPSANFSEIPAYPQTLSKNDEIKMLKSQAESLNRTQKDIEKRISELESQSK